MTGRQKDKILGLVDYLRDKLSSEERKEWMGELLDHVCWHCGAELGKAMRACEACGAQVAIYMADAMDNPSGRD